MYCKKRFMMFAMLFLMVGTLLPSFVSNADVEKASAVPVNQASGAGGDKVKKKVTKKNENFQVEVEYGIDGYAVWDYPVVVRVTVKSNQNFEGILQVKTEQTSLNAKETSFGEDIALAAGEAKTFSFTLDSVNEDGKIIVSILNEKEKVIYSESDTTTVEPAGTRIAVGILSDDYSALNYFDGIPILLGSNTFISSTFELTKDSLVPDSYGLSILQYIIIDNFDTANLSDAQYKALKEWVNNGGVLVLSLGANYQNVLHKFSDDFVSGSLGALEKKEIEWNQPRSAETEFLEEIESDNENTFLSLPDVDSVDFELKDGHELSTFSSNQTAYKKDVGTGAVVVLSYDLGMEPIVSFASNKEMAALFFQTSTTTGVYNGVNGNQADNSNLYYGLDLADYANNSKKPSAVLYGLLLSCYVVFIGPLLYLLLKKLKKREKIWIAIPVVAILFTGVIYLTGFLYRVRTPMTSSFTMTNLDKDIKEEEVFVNLICPKAKRYKVEVINGYSNFRQDKYSYDYSLFGVAENNGTCMIKQTGDGLELNLDCAKTFDNTKFRVSKVSENDIGDIDCNIQCYTNGFEGTITNNTNKDLKEVIVSFENYFYCAGDIKRGESVTIDKTKLFTSSPYGNTVETYFSNEIKNYYTNEYYTMLGRIYSGLENIYSNDSSYYGTCNIWAFTEDYIPELVDRNKIKQTGFGVLTKSFAAEYEDVKGAYYPTIEPMVVSGDFGFEKGSGLMYNQEVEVTYSFNDFPGITRLELALNEDTNQTGDVAVIQYAQVSAFNPETGLFEPVFIDGADLSGDEFKKYVNGNTLILKYTSETGEYYNTYIPKILARGDE